MACFIPSYQLPSCDPPLSVDLSYNGTLISFRWHTFFVTNESGEPSMRDAARALFEDILKHREKYIREYCCVNVDPKTLDIQLKDDSANNVTNLVSEVFPKFTELKKEYDKLKPLIAFI